MQSERENLLPGPFLEKARIENGVMREPYELRFLENFVGYNIFCRHELTQRAFLPQPFR